MNRKIGVILSYVLMVVEIFSTLFYTPLMIRSFGQAEYGVYQLTLSITSYLALLDLGVGVSVVRYMSKYRADNDSVAQRKFLGVSTVYYLGVSAIAVLAGGLMIAFFSDWFAKGLTPAEIQLSKQLLLVTLGTTVVSLSTSAFSNTLIAFERFTVSRGTLILITLFKMIISIIALKCGVKSLGIVWIQFAMTCLTRFAYTAYVLLKLKIIPIFKGMQKNFLKEVAGYSTFVLLQMIAGNLNALSNQVILAAFAKNAAVVIGIYGIGNQVLQYFKTIGSHFTDVLMPGLVRLVENKATKQQYEQEMVRIGRLIFMVLSIVWVVFLVNGEQFVTLWAGAENVQAYWVALVLMFPTLFTYTQGVGYKLLQAMAKHKPAAIAQVIASVLNIVLAIFLVQWDALKGAIISSFTALMISEVLVMNVMYKKQIGIRLTAYFKGLLHRIAPCLLLSLIAGILLRMCIPIGWSWIGFVLNCIGMVAVYGGCMLAFGMNDYEKHLILSPIQKILHREKSR